MSTELKSESEIQLYAESNSNIKYYNLSWYTIMKSTIRFSSPILFEAWEKLKTSIYAGGGGVGGIKKIEDGGISPHGKF